MQTIILKTATRLMVGLLLIFAVYLLFRGHQKPGGGFAAALVAGTAIALFFISEGPAKVRRAVRIRPAAMAVTGLVLAVTSGIPAVFTGRFLFTGLWFKAVGSPLAFDIGIFLSVLGAILSILLALEET